MYGRNSIHLAQFFFVFFLPFCHDSVGTTHSEVAGQPEAMRKNM